MKDTWILIRKNAVLIIVFVLGFYLTQQWIGFKKTYHHTKQEKYQRSLLVTRKHITAQKSQSPERLITLRNKDIKVFVNESDVSIQRVDLQQYKQKLQGKALVSPIGIISGRRYWAENHIFSDSHTQGLTYHLVQRFPNSSDKKFALVFEARQSGVIYEKRIILEPTGYHIIVQNHIINRSKKNWRGGVELGLKLNINPQATTLARLDGGEVNPSSNDAKFTFQGFRSFSGASYYTKEKPYTKIKDAQFEEEKLDLSKHVNGGWVAFQVPYFINAWVPLDEKKAFVVHANARGDVRQINMQESPNIVQPQGQWSQEAILYVGPEKAATLKKLAKGLDLTVDYGWLWMISSVIYQAMSAIHQYVHNWGLSIIIVTLALKLLMAKFSASAFRSSLIMRKLKPIMDELKTRHQDDPMAMRKAMADLYKKEKADPMGGCLPNMMGFPLFIALYFVLIESVELRHAPFVLWIHDLSSKDPFYVLPILYSLSMWYQQKNMPQAEGPMNDAMKFMPIFMLFLFSTFPSGLVLYMLVNNTFTILQNNWVLKQMQGHGNR